MFIADTHADTLMVLSAPENRFTKGNGPMITPERLKAGGVSLQVCALFAWPKAPGTPGSVSPQEAAEMQLAALPRLAVNGVRKVDSPFDVKPGENCVMLSIEGGEVIGTSLEALREYRKKGVRLLALTWNYENEMAYPHCDQGHKGLKPFGWEAVREMNRLNIAADVSHLGEGGFWDLIFHSDKAPMASHSCCRKLRNHTRNLTDDQIKALIARGGWMGINFYTAFLTDQGKATLDTLIDHIVRVGELGGIENVGFGSDFDGIDAWPEGLGHPGEMPNVIAQMEKRGLTRAEIEGVAGVNFLNYMKRLEAK